MSKALQTTFNYSALEPAAAKVAQAGEVLTRWSKEYRAGTAAIVQDIRREPLNVWKKTWCKPDNWERWEGMK